MCRKCPPSPSCTLPTEHIKDRSESRGVPSTPHVQNLSCNTRTSSTSIGQTNSRLDGLLLANDLDEMESVISEESVTPEDLFGGESKKDTLMSLMDLLTLPPSIVNRVPTKGIKNISENICETKRAVRILMTVIDAVTNLLLYDEDESPHIHNALHVYMDEDEMIRPLSDGGSLCNKLVTLGFFGNRKTSLVCQSVMATSLPRLRCKTILNTSYEALEDGQKPNVSTLRRSMGREKFSSLRKTFKILKSGCDIPKHNYTFRIDAHKISNAISFLQESLQVKPGSSHNVCVAVHLFRDMAVYDQGGKSQDDLLASYVGAIPSEERVGRQTFRDMIKLLSKSGETKAGLSTYYIHFRYSSNTFVLMMKRLEER